MLYIFDWDGTLSDSTGTIVSAMQRAADELRWRVPETEAVRNIIGLGLPEALRELYPEVAESDWGQIRDGYRKHYLALDQENPAELYPRVLDSLDKLRREGHTLTIATGKSRAGLDRVLARLELDGFFHASRCADETASKPDPLMLQELLDQFALPARDAVMVGDTEYDMEMGRRVSMPRLAVSYGAHHIDRLRPYEPELCMDCFSEILRWRQL